MTETPFHTKHASKPTENSKLSRIFAAAHTYGERSFDNYAQIRSIAENIRNMFCRWLDSADGPCVFLVPPEGPFVSENYQSGAFSVSGQGYLPLKPISFGLAVRISEDKDFMRIKMHCRKEGDIMRVSIGEERPLSISLPVDEKKLEPLFESLFSHLIGFFQDSVDEYDEGDYGTSVIGFDILRVSE